MVKWFNWIYWSISICKKSSFTSSIPVFILLVKLGHEEMKWNIMVVRSPVSGDTENMKTVRSDPRRTWCRWNWQSVNFISFTCRYHCHFHEMITIVIITINSDYSGSSTFLSSKNWWFPWKYSFIQKTLKYENVSSLFVILSLIIGSNKNIHEETEKTTKL